MERRDFLKFALGAIAGAAAVAASATAAPLMPQPLDEDAKLPANPDAQPAVTSKDEADSLTPEEVARGAVDAAAAGAAAGAGAAVVGAGAVAAAGVGAAAVTGVTAAAIAAAGVAAITAAVTGERIAARSQRRLKAGFPAFFVFGTASQASRQTKNPAGAGFCLELRSADQ